MIIINSPCSETVENKDIITDKVPKRFTIIESEIKEIEERVNSRLSSIEERVNKLPFATN